MSVSRDRLPAHEATELAHALAQLSSHGLPLGEGLRALAEDVPQRRMRRMLLKLADALARGDSLEKALSEQGGQLPPALLGMVRASAGSQRLGELLEEYLLLESQAAELRRRMWVALAYPLALCLFCFAIISFVELAVVPQLAALTHTTGSLMSTADRGPRLSIFMTQISKQYPAFLVGVGAATVMLTVLFRFFLSQAVRQRLRQRIPLIGAALRWTSWAHFCSIAALLLEHRTPLVEALKLAGQGTGNFDLIETSGLIAQDSATGALLRGSYYARARMPPSLFEMVAGAESQGTLPQGFRAAARMASARAQMQTGLVLLVAPWLGFIAISILVVLCMLAIFLPMVNLLRFF